MIVVLVLVIQIV